MNQNTEIVSYTARIELTNSAKVGFSRRDLGLCFYPPKVIEKYDRLYEILNVEGTRTHEDNADFLRKIWPKINKKYIYDGSVIKEPRRSFNWSLLAKRICKKYNLKRFKVDPERQKSAHAPVKSFSVTTNTPDRRKHDQKILEILEIVRQGNRHLTYKTNCSKKIIAPCPVPLEIQLAQ